MENGDQKTKENSKRDSTEMLMVSKVEWEDFITEKVTKAAQNNAIAWVRRRVSLISVALGVITTVLLIFWGVDLHNYKDELKISKHILDSTLERHKLVEDSISDEAKLAHNRNKAQESKLKDLYTTIDHNNETLYKQLGKSEGYLSVLSNTNYLLTQEVRSEIKKVTNAIGESKTTSKNINDKFKETSKALDDSFKNRSEDFENVVNKMRNDFKESSKTIDTKIEAATSHEVFDINQNSTHYLQYIPIDVKLADIGTDKEVYVTIIDRVIDTALISKRKAKANEIIPFSYKNETYELTVKAIRHVYWNPFKHDFATISIIKKLPEDKNRSMPQ